MTIAENILKWGTGGINIDGARIETNENLNGGAYSKSGNRQPISGDDREGAALGLYQSGKTVGREFIQPKGRFPANFLMSHHPNCEYTGTTKIKGTSTGNGDAKTGEGSINIPLRRGTFTDRTDENGLETVEVWNCHPDCPIRILDEQSGITKSKSGNPDRGTYKKAMFANSNFNKVGAEYNDKGGASRFFYVAKASAKERDKGMEWSNQYIQRGNGFSSIISNTTNPRANNHPTVKPIALMRYLVRLITPPNGICLDPFNGSGTTGIACKLEGFNYIGIDAIEEYCEISRARISAWEPEVENKDAQGLLF